MSLLGRLVAFYALQFRLLWTWRAGRRALVRRALVTFGVGFVALGLTVWLVPGIRVRDPGAIAAAVVVLALLNALVRPVILALATPISPVLIAVATIVFQVAAIVSLGRLVPGLSVDDVGSAFLGSWVYAVANTFLTSLLSIDRDESYFGALVRQLVAGRRDVVRTDRPGIVVVQIDGLSHDVLAHQIRAGRVPTLSRWLRRGSHRLGRWEALLPTSTSASQAGILHGDSDAIPGFRWYEKATGRLLVANRPADAAEIERRLRERVCRATGAAPSGDPAAPADPPPQVTEPLLAPDGASVGNLFSGGAARSYLTVSTLADPSQGLGQGSAFFTFFFSPYGYLHTLVLTVGEMVKEIVQAVRQRRAGIEPRLERGGLYPLLRALTNVLLRNLSTAIVIDEMYRGTPRIYVDYVDYDEIAHRAGPERAEALDALDGIDGVLATLERAAADAPRPYRFVVLSDHGQTLGATFRQRYGTTFEALVRDLAGGGAAVRAATARAEEWSTVSRLLSEFSQAEGVGPRLARRALRRRIREGIVDLGPTEAEEPGEAPPGEEPPGVGEGPGGFGEGPGVSGDAGEEAADRDRSSAPPIVVCASGNLALVYFTAATRPFSLEAIRRAHPGLVEGLLTHPGIGLVLARTEAGEPVALGRAGARSLADDRIEGADPTRPYGPFAPEALRRLAAMPNAGDLVVLSAVDPGTEEVAAFEELIGSHGGLGGPQAAGVLVVPSDWPAPPSEPLVGADAVGRQLRRWIDALDRGGASMPPPPTAPTERAGAVA
ncbi:MAG TPA: phage holin family protein, partial [Candidatus Binatia bacterium]|nr:phage holin family protein [Candidatus Binatia bacterium]